MRWGLLWYDGDPRTDLLDKVAAAARRHRKKYGTEPDLCYVHPSVLSNTTKIRLVGGVRVASKHNVLVNHFWIGVDKRKEKGEKANASES